MTAANTIEPGNTVDRVFGVLAEVSTYKRLLLLLVGFPLGIFYFVSTAVMTSVGIGLIPIVVGLGILAAALWVVTLYARLERQLLESLAGATFRPERRAQGGIRAHLLDPAAWKRVAYFALRLPLSVAGFGVAMLMLASLSLLFAPLLYTVVPMWVGVERVTEWQEALLVACAGAVLGLLSAHAVSAMAGAQRRIAEWLL